MTPPAWSQNTTLCFRGRMFVVRVEQTFLFSAYIIWWSLCVCITLDKTSQALLYGWFLNLAKDLHRCFWREEKWENSNYIYLSCLHGREILEQNYQRITLPRHRLESENRTQFRYESCAEPMRSRQFSKRPYIGFLKKLICCYHLWSKPISAN